ncbi:acyl-CoA dehydrogenase family protein [Pseudorhodoplanes sinuspersici]|uniref:DNA alkylation response protein n=1 Tax=Pseudorhodoplanes sinuspersici TaxID=1235591 RepID=A0A1W6ZWJ0_9HYPH|nr:acyl-CoA dehydrogenase family protein [Pseudorhodoplanes sinuspersici]ARQ01491.1 DNA alkylation response protein [Pseudorhodoplanes sinuspersici]RKE73188.1 putative acyl-CoA dehydrogenase [Pseudorhodoplanes sinuspersici]
MSNDARTDSELNQPPSFVDVNLFSADRALCEAVAANGGGTDDTLMDFGRRWGRAEMFDLARSADANSPRLGGDIVTFDPAYHRFMAESMAEGLHCSTWNIDGQPASAPSEVLRASRFYMVAQVENGHMCPITMTRASVAALAAAPKLLAQVMPKIASRTYDPEFRSWHTKSAMTLGMSMTEKQGGTDVRTNTTQAVRDGDAYRLNGQKWFMSAPMSDAFLVLAQASDGLTCFFMPRFRPDASENGLHFVKLKDKLGNRSNASSEVEFHNAYALRVGDEGRGIRTILQMVQLTRLDCAISSAGIMRAALARAVHHARFRIVFQRNLVDQPMMRAVLADLALDSEAAVAVVMRLCRSFDLAKSNASEAARARVLTPLIKYWICKTAPAFVYEAMECLGGNGYVEDYVLARLYREAPVNAIWEGSGNVMALDVLRALRSDEARSVMDSLGGEVSDFPVARETIDKIVRVLNLIDVESHARFIVEHLALIAAVASLQKSAPEIAEIFSQTRLNGGSGRTYGAANFASMHSRLLERVLPTAK